MVRYQISDSEPQPQRLNDHRKHIEHQRLGSVVIPDSATIGSQVSSKNKKSSDPNSLSDSLFGDSDTDSDTPLASKSTTRAPAEPKPIEPPDRILDTVSKKSLPEHQRRRMNPLVKEMALPLQSHGPLGISTKARISGLSSGNVGPKSADPVSPSIRNFTSTITSNAVASEVSNTLQPSTSTSTEFDATKWLKENIVSACDLP